MLTLLYVVSTLISLTISQEECDWYQWRAKDWPESQTQDFEMVIDYTDGVKTSNYYLDDADFDIDPEGEYAGYKWEEVLAVSPGNFRPLGYKWAQLGANNDPTVCLNVSNAKGYAVELMVYTLTPGAYLCIEDMNNDAYSKQPEGSDTTICSKQKIYGCFGAFTDDDNLQIAVYCGENCEDGSAVDLMFRFRRSSLAYDDARTASSNNPAMWCSMIASQRDWPDEIEEADVPDDYKVANLNEIAGEKGSANGLIAMASIVVSCIVCMFV